MKKISTLLFLIAVIAFNNSNAQLSVPCGQQSIYWSDDFEGAIPNWSADNGVWQTGVPTSGPNSAHNGTKCAATNLSGNYPIYTSSRLTNNQYITIPSSTLNPRLRFWSWYSFATQNGWDYGRVQIRTILDSNWTSLTSYTYTANSSGVWSREEIDLSSYADSVIQLGFLMQDIQSSSGAQSSGWYIDEIEIITGPYIYINPEGFENGWNDWSAEGTWEIGIPTVGPTSGCNGTSCAGTNLNGNYGIYSYGHLKSPWMKLPMSSPSISFCHWFSFATQNGADYGTLQIRTQTSGWIDISTYTGPSPLWTNVFFNLSAYAGDTVQFGFFLQDVQSSSGAQSSGWYIDDVYINGLPDTSCLYPLGVGIYELEQNFDYVKVYPNPIRNKAIIEFNNIIKTGTLIVLNTLGEKLIEKNIFNESKKEISFENISTGIYFLKVFVGKKYYCKKIMIEQD